MKDYFQNVLDFVSNQLQLIDKCFKLNPKHYKNNVKLQDAYRRNRVLVMFNLFGAFSTIQHTIQGHILPTNCLVTLSVITITLLLLTLGCRTHPQVFKISYNILIGISGPIFTTFNDGGFIRAWLGVQIYPLVVLIGTGSLPHFFAQCFLQFFYLESLYASRLVQILTFVPPEKLAIYLTQTTNSIFAIRISILACSHLLLQNAHENISIAEKGKTEAERQKNFLLGFSHELRNLINSIMGNVKLASMENLSEKAKDFLRNADVCSEMLLHLINNILDTGKVEVNDLEINPMPTDIYETIERTWSICAELIRRKNLRGTLKLQRDLPQMLKIDHYRLTQIFLNIVGNAVKFTETGSIDITVEWINDSDQVKDKHFEPHPYDEGDLSEGTFEKNQKFTASINTGFMSVSSNHVKVPQSKIIRNNTSQKGILKIVINDTGSGIEKGHVDKLFQKFVQVTSDTSKRKLGTGLGLFITKELCEKMDGRIRVYSKEGKGSCFILCLPVLPLLIRYQDRVHSELSLRDVNPNKDTIANFNLKALVVDDEQLSQNILTVFLNKLKCEVIGAAANGQEAVSKYIQHSSSGSVNIVTMDLTMPVMDGKQASQKIREYETSRQLEPCILIIISGNCSESEMTECLNPRGKIRANAFLKKPATLEELSKIISQIRRINHGIYSLSQDFIEMRTSRGTGIDPVPSRKPSHFHQLS